MENEKKEIQCITLNKDLFANVRIGKKVSMTVPGVKDFNVGNAYFVDPEDNDKRCKVVINTIFLSTFEDNLKDEMHCKLEGYDTKRQFLDYMYGNYGKIEPQDIMTTIFFSYRQVEGV